MVYLTLVNDASYRCGGFYKKYIAVWKSYDPRAALDLESLALLYVTDGKILGVLGGCASGGFSLPCRLAKAVGIRMGPAARELGLCAEAIGVPEPIATFNQLGSVRWP